MIVFLCNLHNWLDFFTARIDLFRQTIFSLYRVQNRIAAGRKRSPLSVSFSWTLEKSTGWFVQFAFHSVLTLHLSRFPFSHKFQSPHIFRTSVCCCCGFAQLRCALPCNCSENKVVLRASFPCFISGYQ